MTVHARTIEGEIWICTRAIDLDRSIDRSTSIDVEGGIFPGKPARAVDGTLCVGGRRSAVAVVERAAEGADVIAWERVDSDASDGS